MNRFSFKEVLKKGLRVALVLLVALGGLSLLADLPFVRQFLQDRFHRRIETELTRALGRRVKGGDLDFTVLSGIGFNMQNVYIDEAPAFGAEPFLYADHVHFVLSWQSLLAGRLALSRITLGQASLNLVRNAEGQWNFETWFSDSSGAAEGLTPRRAPARDRTSREGPSHPLELRIYLDTDRINFKDLSRSYEKKVFILTEVSGKIEPAWFNNGIDFDLRMKASRTDVPMENSGMIRVAGSLGPFQSPSIWPATIQGQAKLEKFPYSDMVVLLTGRMTYLHGLMEGRASFKGPLNGLIQLNGSLDLVDLHSWAAPPREQFHSASLEFPLADLRIGGPLTLSNALLKLGSSRLEIFGGVDRLADPRMNLIVASRQFSLDDLLDFARGFTTRVPANTHVKGDARVECHLTGPWKSPVISGQMAISGGQIQSEFLPKPGMFGPVDVSFENGALTWGSLQLGDRAQHPIQLEGSIGNLFGSPQLTLDALGSEVAVENIDEMGRSFGLWPPVGRAEGTIDLSLHWGRGKKQPDQPSLTGRITGHNIAFKTAGADDIRIAAVKYEAKNNVSQVSITRLSWGRSMASGNLQFKGLEPGQAQVNLTAGFLDLSELLQLSSQARGRLVASVLDERGSAGSPRPSSSSQFRWTGTLSSSAVYFNRLRVTNLHSDFECSRRSFILKDFSFDAYGGRSQGQLDLDWEKGQPRLRVVGSAENVNLEGLTGLLTPLGSPVEGHISGDYALSGEKLKGQLWPDALSCKVRATVRDLRNVALRLPAATQEIRSRLNLPPSLIPKEAPFLLDIDLDYTPEKIKIGEARLVRGDLQGTFTGVCSRDLELNLSGMVEKVVPKKGGAAPSISLSIQGPIARPAITFTPHTSIY